MAKTILIVDDNADLRNITKMTLQFGGYAVLEAGDGVEALEMLRQQPADLVVSDLAMPRMTGSELLAQLRADAGFQSLPFIMCTAEENVSKDDMIKRGASAVVAKPYRPLDLLETIKRLLA